MNPTRKRRLTIVLLVIAAATVAVALIVFVRSSIKFGAPVVLSGIYASWRGVGRG